MSAASGKLIRGATSSMGDGDRARGPCPGHVERKMFSGASTEFGGRAEQPCLARRCGDAGHAAGDQRGMRQASCPNRARPQRKINLRSVFERKNDFYPDRRRATRSANTSRRSWARAKSCSNSRAADRHVGIERLHLEQDAGKCCTTAARTCPMSTSIAAAWPDGDRIQAGHRDAEQAKAYVTKLRSILRYLGTCDGDMEKGSLRADVNVSVRKPGGPLGTRCEIKNMNSISFIGDAIEYEARRQIEIIEDGGSIDQETRLYDPNKGETRSMRSKEEAHDYRYFPDPDLLPLEFSEAYVAELKAGLPELSDQKKARFIADLGLSPYDAGVLVAERESADFFETVLAGLADKSRDGKLAANWVINELFGRLNKEGRDITASPVSAEQLAAIVGLIGEGTISGKIAKDLFEMVWTEGGDPRALVELRGMKQVTDLGAIEKVVDEIIAGNPDKVAQARARPQLVGWFVGQVMKSSGGKANPQAVNDLLKSKLGI